MPRRRRPNWPVRLIVLGLASTFVVYTVVMPIWQRSRPSSGVGAMTDDMTLGEIMGLRGAEAMATLWFFVFGACVGSFLNVVVYRLPRRMSLFGYSRCPWCITPIQPRDNIPVLGWLMRRGRCRACWLPISGRYPIVELITGLLFVLLLFVEVLSGGTNLPLREPYSRGGFVWTVYDTKWDLVRIYSFHLYLLSILWASTLIRFDRKPIPTSLVAVAVILGFGLPAVWPDHQPVAAWIPPVSWPAPLTWMSRFETSGLGLLAGLGLGLVCECVFRWRRPDGVPGGTGLGKGLVLVGLYLGWQAVVAIAAATVVLSVVGAMSGRIWPQQLRVPAVGHLTIATILHICFWNRLTT